MASTTLGVAEAKRRFSELLERARKGECFVIHRHGEPAAALVAPDMVVGSGSAAPIGLAAVAGSLVEWEDLEEIVEDTIRSRQSAAD